MNIVTLGDVATIDRRSIKPEDIKDGTLYVGLEHITNDGKFGDVLPVASSELSSSKFCFDDRHILYGKLRPYLKKIALPSFSGICSTDILPIKVGPEVNKGYLFYFLRQQSMIDMANSLATGVNLPRLSPRQLVNFKIPLPPLAEQQRIAAILDKADALRAKRRAALAKLDTLLQATFLHMFGDPVTNPMGWEELKAGEVINDIATGESYGGEQRTLKADEIGVLKISAVTTGKFIPTEYKAVKISDIRRDVIKPRKGDILFSRANTRELVAATCIVDQDYDHIFLPDKLWRIDFNHNRCTNWYFKFLLSHEGFRNRLTGTATGTSGSMLNISQAKLKSLIVPLPPIELQAKFSEFANKIREQKNRLEKALEHFDNLFHTLQQRAFKGEL